MKLSSFSLLPLALLPSINASFATDIFSYANSLVSSQSGEEARMHSQMSKDGPISIMDSWTWTNCGTAADVVQLKSIKVSPDPPVPGKNLTVTVDAEVLQVIEDGAYVDVTVKLGLIKLLQKEFDVCEEAKNANATVQCPVQKGPYSVSQTVELPKEIPKAKFSVAVRGFTVDDEDMVCLDLLVDFMKRPGSV
ncbi:ML domain-domain-containing protein [Kockovaella imperatae]|uniref:Phosphatidylglycerol/phosphatidylinositol transfer protein n=1 Tax=Kockovaella imperatae TaxID=4999 RepID=A0A1Y1UPY1_9TREE|nr:ML domain-domain-containing protein [Kockovaella imperatae]ORX40120.1 ML domain-domain-containing protein [Kockovaella imperatae]